MLNPKCHEIEGIFNMIINFVIPNDQPQFSCLWIGDRVVRLMTHDIEQRSRERDRGSWTCNSYAELWGRVADCTSPFGNIIPKGLRIPISTTLPSSSSSSLRVRIEEAEGGRPSSRLLRLHAPRTSTSCST